MSQNRKAKSNSAKVLAIGPELSTATILFHETVASRLDLNATDMKCLTFINSSKTSVTAGDVAQFTRLTTGAVTGILNRLEKAKLIARAQDKEDRRKVILVPNEAAFKKIKPLYQSFAKSMEKLVSDYSEEDLGIVADFLKRVTEILELEASRLRE
ncbi:MarR family winged helix-turn-helix transcriptional regulator [Bdellovibrio sp. HCB-162]|uniref:MarR family winged helix-turn-helix transcriptional regulator n=1 Tax=Bdellovibrio sp. HCB-162 TaxID=3394234 RepID=UPI0039BD19C0